MRPLRTSLQKKGGGYGFQFYGKTGEAEKRNS
jgi:hypothetical protein